MRNQFGSAHANDEADKISNEIIIDIPEKAFGLGEFHTLEFIQQNSYKLLVKQTALGAVLFTENVLVNYPPYSGYS